MKKISSEVRKKWVTIRMNETEFESLQKLFKKSYCRQISEYLRAVALQKPVTIRYRNEAGDEILSAFLKIKMELNAIGNNLNQAVHQLHTLDRIPEFRGWLTLYENCRQMVVKVIVETKDRMDEIYRQWLQK